MSQDPAFTAPAHSHEDTLSEHHLKPEVERRLQLMLIFSLVVMMAALIWSLYRWYFAYARFGPAVVWRWSGPAIGIAFLALLLALYSGLFLLRNRKRKIFTSTAGLWLIHGGNRTALKWQEISSIRSYPASFALSRSGHDPQLRINLRTVDDNLIKLPTFLTELDIAQEIIKKNVYPLAMNRYRALLEADQPLEFGPLQLTRSGVVFRNHTEPWQNFHEVDIEAGRLNLEFRSPEGSSKISIAARKIPNIDLCVQLLRNIEY